MVVVLDDCMHLCDMTQECWFLQMNIGVYIYLPPHLLNSAIILFPSSLTMMPHVSRQQVKILVCQGCSHGQGHLLDLASKIFLHAATAVEMESESRIL